MLTGCLGAERFVIAQVKGGKVTYIVTYQITEVAENSEAVFLIEDYVK